MQRIGILFLWLVMTVFLCEVAGAWEHFPTARHQEHIRLTKELDDSRYEIMRHFRANDGFIGLELIKKWRTNIQRFLISHEVLSEDAKKLNWEDKLALEISLLESTRRIWDTLQYDVGLRTFYHDQLDDEGALFPRALNRAMLIQLSRKKVRLIRKQLQRYIKRKKALARYNTFPPMNPTRRMIEDSMAWYYETKMKPGMIRYALPIFADPGLVVQDVAVGTWIELGNMASGTFGNVIGAVKWRKGHLDNNKNVMKQMNQTLRPFDIIIEKTSNTATDFTIPGHFAHAAVYLGSENQLIEAGLWEMQELDPFREKIKKGDVVIEALREGVRINPLERFMNIDEVAVIRQKDVADSSLPQKQELLRSLLSNWGKSYDFNFDVNSTKRVTCTEIIAHSFPELDWETSFIMGRHTLSPDNVALSALKESNHMDVVLYLKGHEDGSVDKLDVTDLRNIIAEQ